MSTAAGIQQPVYTQTPNILFDELMPKMGDAELRVCLAIIRNTFGWQRQSHKMSLSYLGKATGLSRQGVLNGINAGIERGIIRRESSGQGFRYGLLVNDVDHQLVNEVDQLDAELVNDVDQGSQRGRPVLVNDVDHQLVNDVDTTKKELLKKGKKELQRKTTSSAEAETVQPAEEDLADEKQTAADEAIDGEVVEEPAPKREPSEWQQQVGALCWVCYGHDKVADLTAEQKGQLTREAKTIFKENGYTIDDLRTWYRDEWRARDWRGQKNQRPAPSHVRTGIAAVRSKAMLATTVKEALPDAMEMVDWTQTKPEVLRYALAKGKISHPERIDWTVAAPELQQVAMEAGVYGSSRVGVAA